MFVKENPDKKKQQTKTKQNNFYMLKRKKNVALHTLFVFSWFSASLGISKKDMVSSKYFILTIPWGLTH